MKHRIFTLAFAFWLPVLLATIGVSPIAARGESIEETRKVLEDIRRRITETSRDLTEKSTAERSLAEDLRTVEREVSRFAQRIEALSNRLARTKKEIAARETQIEHMRSEIGQLKEKVRERLAALYKAGETGMLQVLFASVSPARMAEEYDFLGRIVRRDRELLDSFRSRLEELEKAAAELATLRRSEEELLAGQRRERAELEKAAKLKEQLLVRLRKEKSTLAAELEGLQERAGRLADLIKKLESARTTEYTEKTVLFANRKGRLPWPAKGPVKVGFGAWRHPELGTLHESQGIEIRTAVGEPVTAVGRGKVLFANWFKGYGNLLILDHGHGYYTLYAQIARLNKGVGEPVEQGEVLGVSGFDGADHLYFEIRHHGTPLDPAAWLAPR